MSRSRIVLAIFVISSYLFAQDIDEAIRLFNSFQFDRAREIFREIIKKEDSPRIAEAYYYLGRLSVNPDSALAYYNVVIVNYPQSRYCDISYLEIAKNRIAREKYKNAIVTLNELLRKFPDTNLMDEVLFWLGVSHMSSGQEEQGIRVLENLRKTFPKSLWSERAASIMPATHVPEVAKEYFTIQVGSYLKKVNAERHAQQIREKEFAVQIVEALVKGKTYFRVWVGKFPNIDEAKTFSSKLETMGIKGNVVKGY
jgi:TolA-binding protein